jgi:hypothetical protein
MATGATSPAGNATLSSFSYVYDDDGLRVVIGYRKKLDDYLNENGNWDP